METKRLSSLLKLIANPDRMTILFMLMDSERSIAELSEALGQPATAVSNHLAAPALRRSDRFHPLPPHHRIPAGIRRSRRHPRYVAQFGKP